MSAAGHSTLSVQCSTCGLGEPEQTAPAIVGAASLYRMATQQHICPFGLKSLDLLQRRGFEVDDHLLKTREETDEFMAQEHSRRRRRLS